MWRNDRHLCPPRFIGRYLLMVIAIGAITVRRRREKENLSVPNIYIYMYMCNIHSVRGVKRKIREQEPQELFSPLF